MTVSRKGKSGTRAGGKTHRPYGRNGRVRRTAAWNNLAKRLDERPTKTKMSREEFMIHAATIAVGKRAGFGFVQADDLVSDIILMLLDAGGISWPEEEIKDFCRKKSQWMVERWKSRREISECEFEKNGTFSEEGSGSILEDMSGFVRAMQDLIVDCNTWRQRLKSIPDQQRMALEILIDGGNPIDVAEEMDITPWKAIALIREGRDYIHRVDPANEPW